MEPQSTMVIPVLDELVLMCVCVCVCVRARVCVCEGGGGAGALRKSCSIKLGCCWQQLIMVML